MAGPILIIRFGFGSRPNVALVWMMRFFPLALAAHTGLTVTPSDLAEPAWALRRLPLAGVHPVAGAGRASHLFAGPRVALPLALIGAVNSELRGGVSGLGVEIQTEGTRISGAFAAVVLLAVIGAGMFYLLAGYGCQDYPWIRHTTACT